MRMKLCPKQWLRAQDGQTGDKFSMHAGCPVIKGEKWSATKCAALPPPPPVTRCSTDS